MVDHLKYPFLVEIGEYMRERGYGSLSLMDILSPENEVVREAIVRIRESTKGKLVPYSSYKDPVITFYVVLILLSGVKERAAIKRYVGEEAKHFLGLLSNEELEDLISIASLMGIRVERRKLTYGGSLFEVALKFTDFLKLERPQNLKLSSRPVVGGYVFLTKRDLAEICSLRVKERMLSWTSGANFRVPEPLTREVMKILIPPREIPPCIRNIVERARDPLTEEELRAAIVFYLNIGHSKSAILSVFNDQNRAKVMSEIRRMSTGRNFRYIVYSCEKMKELGMCIAECKTLSPLQFYFGLRDSK